MFNFSDPKFLPWPISVVTLKKKRALVPLASKGGCFIVVLWLVRLQLKCTLYFTYFICFRSVLDSFFSRIIWHHLACNPAPVATAMAASCGFSAGTYGKGYDQAIAWGANGQDRQTLVSSQLWLAKKSPLKWSYIHIIYIYTQFTLVAGVIISFITVEGHNSSQ